MRRYQESGFLFDFTAANDAVVHDKAPPDDGNTFWPGVDFRIIEDNREIWIEVKSWSFKRILDRVERRQAKKDYADKLDGSVADEFRDDIVMKFCGTTCYLTWAGLGVPQQVYYVVFLEPPNRNSRALLGPFQDRLRNEFKNAQARSWGQRIRYKVMDLAEFEKEFPNYPVERV